MEKRIALIKDGLVKNVIVADDNFSGAEMYPGYMCIDVTNIFCGPGMLYADGQFTQPEQQGE